MEQYDIAVFPISTFDAVLSVAVSLL